MSTKPLSVLTAASALLLPLAGHAAEPPSASQMWEIIQQQQQEIERLKARLEETDYKAEAAVEASEAMAAGGGSSWADRTTIGGYGELHYNNLDADDSARDLEEADLHRFVLYFAHEFTDDIRFFSEVEIEHGGVESDGDPLGGEVEMEQMFVEFDLNEDDSVQARGGVFLLPVGILNETHEPNTFYGVERNDVENVIIPSTWWAGGAGLSGRFGQGFSWDAALHTGLEMPTAGGSAFRVRSGRQKISNAVAEDPGFTARLKYTGVAGLELAGTLHHQTDASQVNNDGLEEGTLYEVHGIFNRGPFGFRALYAEWDFDGDAVKAADADEQKGWYVEPSYKLTDQWGVYTRYSDVEGARTRDRFDQWEAGVNYWPHPDVVVKADVRTRDHDLNAESGRDFDGFDLGIGYQF